MSTRDRARKAGQASQARLTPEERQARMREVRLAGNVNGVLAAARRCAEDAPQLTKEQRETLVAVLCGGAP